MFLNLIFRSPTSIDLGVAKQKLHTLKVSRLHPYNKLCSLGVGKGGLKFPWAEIGLCYQFSETLICLSITA